LLGDLGQAGFVAVGERHKFHPRCAGDGAAMDFAKPADADYAGFQARHFIIP